MKLYQPLRRFLEKIFDRLGIRPIFFVVFLSSIVLLITLQFNTVLMVKVPAVGSARPVEHPARLNTFVREVHVLPGDKVAPGDPLVTLSPRLLDRELDIIDAEIASLERRLELEQIRLQYKHQIGLSQNNKVLAEAQRDLEISKANRDKQRSRLKAAKHQEDIISQRVSKGTQKADDLQQATWTKEKEEADINSAKQDYRTEKNYVKKLKEEVKLPDDTGLAQTSSFYKSQIKVLEKRKEGLLEDLTKISITARIKGRVATVLPLGAEVRTGTSVASIYPEYATEIIAFIKPATNPDAILTGTKVAIVEPYNACSENGEIIRLGAKVEQAPTHITGLFKTPVHGLPVYISIPKACQLGIGQQLSVEFSQKPKPYKK